MVRYIKWRKIEFHIFSNTEKSWRVLGIMTGGRAQADRLWKNVQDRIWKNCRCAQNNLKVESRIPWLQSPCPSLWPRAHTNICKAKRQNWRSIQSKSILHNRPLPKEQITGNRMLFLDALYPTHASFAFSQVRRVKKGAHQKRICAKDILHHFLVLNGNNQEVVSCSAQQHQKVWPQLLGDRGAV